MKKLLVTLFAVVVLYGCGNSDDNIIPANLDEKYLNGFFITNEGNFTRANASISHLSADFNTFTNDIFKTANGKNLGDVAQSLVINGDYVFVIVNNSNTIEVVNKKTFKSVHTITEGLKEPRYAVVKNNKLYVTSYKDKQVNVYNAQSFDFIQSIYLDDTAENIVVANDYIYAVNNDSFSQSVLVEIIDPATDTNSIDLSFDSPIRGIASNGQFVYILETDNTGSKISKINGTVVVSSVTISQAYARYLIVDGVDLYYTAGTGIYKIANTLSSESSKLFDVTTGNSFSVLRGFDVFDGTIFTSDAKGFTDNSKIVIYKIDGSVVKEFTGGIGTNGFYKF